MYKLRSKKAKKLKSILNASLAVILTAGLISGCSAGKHVSELFNPEEKTENVYTVSIASDRMSTLNPAISFDEDTLYMSRLIYSGLFRLDSNLKPRPDLVKDYSYDDDRTLTLILRNDVRWHDGKDLCADDVVFSINAYKKLGADTLYRDYVANINKVKKLSDDSVTVYFGKDPSTSPENLIFPILPSHLYDDVKDLTLDRGSFFPVGTGMYKVDAYDPAKAVELSANEDYYGEKAKNRIIFSVLPDKKDGINLAETGDINIISQKSYARETFITNKNFEMTEYPSNETEVIGFNMNGAFTKDRRIRQAVAYLTDNKKILDNIYYKNGVFTDSIIYPGYFGTENKGDAYVYNEDKADKLLRSAGLSDKNEDGYLESREGRDIVLRLLVDKDNELRAAAAAVIKESLERKGIAVTTDLEEKEAYMSKLSRGDFDMFIGTVKVGERCDLRPLLHSEYRNAAGYSNKKADALMADILGSTGEKDKEYAVIKLKEILISDIPYYPLFCKTYGLLTSSCFRGEVSPLFTDPYRGSGDWYCEKKILKN